MRPNRLVLFGVVILVAAAASLAGQEYEVTGEDVYVRSGPSGNFYPMLKVSRPQRVDVLAQEGEWLAITPPPGAYSLISKLLVAVDGQTGTVTGNRVIVRAGSVLYPFKTDTLQTHLNRGDKVAILGETEEAYKIAPPAGVAAYISVKYARPVGSPVAATTLPVLPPPPTRPAGSATTAPAVVTSTDSLNRQIRDWQTAEAALTAEYAKPEDQRDLPKMLGMYQAIEVDPEGPLAPRVQYRIRYLELAIERVKGAAYVEELSRRTAAERKEMESARDKIRQESARAAEVPKGFSVDGRLAPSATFPGSAFQPKRWILRSDQGIPYYAQCTTGAVNLAELEGWKVRLIGTRSFSPSGYSIVEVTGAEKLPGGEPAVFAPVPMATTQPAGRLDVNVGPSAPPASGLPDFGPPDAPASRPAGSTVNREEYR